MSNYAIKVEGLGKRYRIGERQKYKALRDVLTDAAYAPVRAAGRLLHRGNPQPRTDSHIWALKDVSFKVQHGEVLGIIGRNGAGKSTLLKILSRITEPTEGEVRLRGRVGSLLEVGTGFHPELTGRENIYLNGAILGMHRHEIEHKFDEIVAFAEIEKFLDTPVKHYSSGMYVRLAFAVAAHLEPEILLVDEVLAVGDAAFQKKCLGKMGEVAGEGRTVLFVSHNMAAVQSLCRAAFLLEHGKILLEGEAERVVARYLAGVTTIAETPLHERTDRRGTGQVRLTSLAVESEHGEPIIRCGDRLVISMGYKAEQDLQAVRFLVRVSDGYNRSIFFLDSEASNRDLPGHVKSSGVVTCTTGPINLTPGPCTLNTAVFAGGVLADGIKQAYRFQVEPDDFHGTGRLTSRMEALCLVEQTWHAEATHNDEDSTSERGSARP